MVWLLQSYKMLLESHIFSPQQRTECNVFSSIFLPLIMYLLLMCTTRATFYSYFLHSEEISKTFEGNPIYHKMNQLFTVFIISETRS